MTEAKAPAKKVELNRQQKLENLFYGLGNLAAMVGAIHWYAGLCWHTRRKYNRYAGPPVCIELFGTHPTDAQDILKAYGIRSTYGSLQWAVVHNEVGLKFTLLLSRASFDYADNILDAHQGQTYTILSNPGSKRGQGLRTPFANRQAAQLTRKQAKLGKQFLK